MHSILRSFLLLVALLLPLGAVADEEVPYLLAASARGNAVIDGS